MVHPRKAGRQAVPRGRHGSRPLNLSSNYPRSAMLRVAVRCQPYGRQPRVRRGDISVHSDPPRCRTALGSLPTGPLSLPRGAQRSTDLGDCGQAYIRPQLAKILGPITTPSTIMTSEKNAQVSQDLSYHASDIEILEGVEKGDIVHNEQPNSSQAVLETRYAGKYSHSETDNLLILSIG